MHLSAGNRSVEDEMNSEVMNIDDVAVYLRISRRSAYALVRSGELPGRKVANRWRFHVRDVEAWLRHSTVVQTHSAVARD